ncbi:MAG: Hsp70 family protein [Thermogutta sp.]
MSRYVPVGIDLGTARIRVAYVDSQGHLEMLRNERDEICIVNAVRFTSQEIIVGKDALTDASLFPPETAIWIKRELGSRTYSRAIHGQRLPPEVIQACVLRKIRGELVHRVAEPLACVIGVPSYFDEVRRNAVVNAGRIAGLRVLDVVDEPLAAALAYAAVGSASNVDQAGRGKTILVFDLGSSSLQVALVRLSSSECRILAKDQDVELGGYDFDVRLGEVVAEAMIAEGYSDPRANPTVWAKLYRLVVDAKHSLSSRSRVNLLYDSEERHFEMSITREQFETCTAPLLQQIERFLKRFLQRSGLGWSEIDLILPVGGAVRTPSVLRLLSQLSGQQVLLPVNVDEAVARGAALFGAWRLREERGEETSETSAEQMLTFFPAALKNQPKVNFGNLVPYAVGIRSLEENEQETICLVPRATPLPFKATHRISLRGSDEGKLTLIVAKNEHGSWEDYGRVVFHDIPQVVPAHTCLELTVECQVNGRLHFHGRILPTAEHLKTEFVLCSALETDAVERWERTLDSSSSWEDLTQATEPPDYDGDQPLKEAENIISGRGETGPSGQEKEGHEMELLPRRRHPRLAAAEAQGRWQPLEIALPPSHSSPGAELKSPPGSASEIVRPSPQLPELVADSAAKGEQESEAPLSQKVSMIRSRPRVTRESLLQSLESSEPPSPSVSAAGSNAENTVGVAQALPSDHAEPPIYDLVQPAIIEANGDGSSSSGEAFQSMRRRSVRVLLPFGLTAPRWLVAAIGFVLSAVLGLSLGYWLIVKFMPQSGLLRIW